MKTSDSPSYTLRCKLNHPVVDADAHWLEPLPIFFTYLEKVGGPKLVSRFKREFETLSQRWHMNPSQRQTGRLRRPQWWIEPGNTLDRATAMLPKLMFERLPDFGIDHAIIYSSLGLFTTVIADDEMRQASCRALNTMASEFFKPFAKRLTPVAVIPAHTPEEAIAELDFAVKTLGFKLIQTDSYVERRIGADMGHREDDQSMARTYFDSIALDSPFDYDPFWKRCTEHQVPIAVHSKAIGSAFHSTINSFTFNHIGHFAAANHFFARALILGGVPRRFPELKFAFLEGGAGWGCTLLSDFIGHLHMRLPENLLKYADPSNLDTKLLNELCRKHGGSTYVDRFSEIVSCLSLPRAFRNVEQLKMDEIAAGLDDFKASGIKTKADLFEQFGRFFFGCEGEDLSIPWAFNKMKSYPVRVQAIFGSDIGHSDVRDMREVLSEAHELVDHGLISQTNFEDFVFTNVARYCSVNSNFFSGTEIDINELTKRSILKSA